MSQSDEVNSRCKSKTMLPILVVVVWQRAFQSGVRFFDCIEGGVNLQRNVILLCVLHDVAPAACGGKIKDVVLGVESDDVYEFFAVLLRNHSALCLKFVACEFQEEQAEDDVLVLGRLDGAAQLVRRLPQRLFHGGAFLCHEKSPDAIISHTPQSANTRRNRGY